MFSLNLFFRFKNARVFWGSELGGRAYPRFRCFYWGTPWVMVLRARYRVTESALVVEYRECPFMQYSVPVWWNSLRDGTPCVVPKLQIRHNSGRRAPTRYPYWEHWRVILATRDSCGCPGAIDGRYHEQRCSLRRGVDLFIDTLT